MATLSLEDTKKVLQLLLHSEEMKKFLPNVTAHESNKAISDIAEFLNDNNMNTAEFLKDNKNKNTIRLAYMAKLVSKRENSPELEEVFKVLLTRRKELDPEKLKECVKKLLLKMNPDAKEKELEDLSELLVKDHLEKTPDNPNKSVFELLVLAQELEGMRNLYGFVPPQFQNILTTFSGYVQRGNEQGISSSSLLYNNFIAELAHHLQGQEIVIDTLDEIKKYESAVDSGLAPEVDPRDTPSEYKSPRPSFVKTTLDKKQ